MLVIRDSQVRSLASRATSRFDLRLRNYLQAELPDYCAALGEDRLAAEIRHGVACGRSFGFSSENAICRFLCLCLVLGRDFHTHPENAWMDEILHDEDDLNPATRMRWLYDGVILRLERAEALGLHVHPSVTYIDIFEATTDAVLTKDDKSLRNEVIGKLIMTSVQEALWSHTTGHVENVAWDTAMASADQAANHHVSAVCDAIGIAKRHAGLWRK